MFNIVENPKSKELYLVGYTTSGKKNSCFDFDGSPFELDVTGWKVIGQVPCFYDWVENPNRYGTHYGAINVFQISPDGEKISFKMAESIYEITKWVGEQRHNGNIVSYVWIGAFSSCEAAEASII